jgi:hypothetical protein
VYISFFYSKTNLNFAPKNFSQPNQKFKFLFLAEPKTPKNPKIKAFPIKIFYLQLKKKDASGTFATQEGDRSIQRPDPQEAQDPIPKAQLHNLRPGLPLPQKPAAFFYKLRAPQKKHRPAASIAYSHPRSCFKRRPAKIIGPAQIRINNKRLEPGKSFDRKRRAGQILD